MERELKEKAMKNKILCIFTTVVIFGFGGIARADIVELNLFDLGCREFHDFNSPSWTTDFDLGITFTEISSVYIDWSGEITGGLAVKGASDPFPIDVGIFSYFENVPNWRRTDVLMGGELTYPYPEPFACLSEFLYGSMPWTELFDGQSKITIEYTEIIISDGSYLEHGSVFLTSATIIVDGTVIPEPSTILLLGIGIFPIVIIRDKTAG